MLGRVMDAVGIIHWLRVFGNFILLGVGVFVTLWISVVVLFGCGSAYSEKYEDLDMQAYASPNKLNKTEYIVIERGVLAATTVFYHERHKFIFNEEKRRVILIKFN